MTRIIRSPSATEQPFKLPHAAANASATQAAAATAANPDAGRDQEFARLREALVTAQARIDELERADADRCAAQDRDLADLRHKIEQEAAEAGHRQGFAAGEAAARGEVAEAVTALAELHEAAKAALQRGLEDLEGVAVQIAFEAVAKVLGQELSQAEGVMALIREVASRAREQAVLTVRLGAKDYGLIQEYREALSQSLNGVRVDLVSDTRIAFGGCVVESDSGTLDGRLEVQLRRLKDAMVAAYQQRGPEAEQ